MIFEDIFALDKWPLFKFDGGALGYFYIISGYIKNGLFDHVLSSLSDEHTDNYVGKHYLISWALAENNNLIIHYSTSFNEKDLFHNQKHNETESLSKLLCSEESLAFYNGRFKWLKEGTHNYRLILHFSTIKEKIYELLQRCNQINRRLVTSLNEFEKLCPNGMWYRGQASVSYKLVPGLFRDAWNEENLYRDGCRYLDFSKNDYENLAQMQHYGLPTRLLDITKDRYVALYMACNTVFNSVESLNDIGVVYGFSPEKLLKIEEADQLCKPLVRFPEKQFVEYHEFDNNDRIKMQKGSFIIFGDDKPLEVEPICYVVNKEHILEELDTIRRSELDLVPEREHRCNYIKQKNRPKSKS